MDSEQHLFTLEEGQLYEGPVSVSGGEGPVHRWIVVAPFGRHYGQSIDDPFDLHWLPLPALHQAIGDGRLRFLGRDPNHPVVQLQRAKELYDIRYAHLGLRDQELGRLFALLESAIASHAEYAVYALGELRALTNVAFDDIQQRAITERVDRLMPQAQALSLH